MYSKPNRNYSSGSCDPQQRQKETMDGHPVVAGRGRQEKQNLFHMFSYQHLPLEPSQKLGGRDAVHTGQSSMTQRRIHCREWTWRWKISGMRHPFLQAAAALARHTDGASVDCVSAPLTLHGLGMTCTIICGKPESSEDCTPFPVQKYYKRILYPKGK